MYDSDRASNGQSTSCPCFLLDHYDSDSCVSSAEDSGNSSEDSQSEDPPDKKASAWRSNSEAPPSREEEVKKEEEITEVTVAANNVTTADAPPCPSMPQENADKLLSKSEKEEEEKAEGLAEDASVSPVHQDEEKKVCLIQERVAKMSPGQEVLLLTPPSRMQPTAASPQPTPTEEEESRSTPLSSPRVKGRKANLREPETPPRILLSSTTTSPSHMPSPPGGVPKRQDEPMVVLHCLPTPRPVPDPVTADSDTDSATEEEGLEEEEAGSQERSNSALKRKAADQRAAEKKLRPDRRQEETTPPKLPPALPKVAAGAPPSSVLRAESERRSEGVRKPEESPRSPTKETPKEVSEERLTGSTPEEPAVHDGAPALVVVAPEPAPTEELEPQIGPEALVCHEVDLDDLDDKEKPSPSPEHLLLMMREQQQVPPPLANLLPSPHLPQPQVRPFLPTTPSEEVHPSRSTADEERGSARGEQEGDSSTSSSTSLLESRDRGSGVAHDFLSLMDCDQADSKVADLLFSVLLA